MAAGQGTQTTPFSQSTSPSAPANVTNAGQTSASVTLAWDAVSVASGAAEVTGYKIYKRTVYDETVIALAGVPEEVVDYFLDPTQSDMVVDALVYDGSVNTDASTTLTGLGGGELHTYVVTAMSAAGEGNRSLVVAVSTCPPAPEYLKRTGTTTTPTTISLCGGEATIPSGGAAAAAPRAAHRSASCSSSAQRPRVAAGGQHRSRAARAPCCYGG